ncbi:hypothetical protein VKT23_008295 [Stygiomarasmius scandens]|uniref:Uncharacterized protein n=1 Tax=Marasmiellus scandens TaxID=2682957 RepID=A0ABR1JIZ7_9AGAR
MPRQQDPVSLARTGILNGAQAVNIEGAKITSAGRDHITINNYFDGNRQFLATQANQRLSNLSNQQPSSTENENDQPPLLEAPQHGATQNSQHRGGKRKRVALRLSRIVKACFPCGATSLNPRQERPPGDDAPPEQQAECDISLSTMGPDPNQTTSDASVFLDHSRPAGGLMPTPISFPHPEVSSPEGSAFTTSPWTSEPEEMATPPISRAHTLPFPMASPPSGPTAAIPLDLDMPTSGFAPIPGRSATISFGTARPFFPIR